MAVEFIRYTKESVKSDINAEEKPGFIDGHKSPENPLATMAACVPQEVSIDRKNEPSYDPKTISSSCQTNLVSGERQILDDLKQGISEDEQISPDNLAVTLQSSKTSPEVSKKDAFLEPHCHFNMEFNIEESLISPTKFDIVGSSISPKLGIDIVVSSSAHVTKEILKRNPLGVSRDLQLLELFFISSKFGKGL